MKGTKPEMYYFIQNKAYLLVTQNWSNSFPELSGPMQMLRSFFTWILPFSEKNAHSRRLFVVESKILHLVKYASRLRDSYPS